jgi:hypothetical protein
VVEELAKERGLLGFHEDFEVLDGVSRVCDAVTGDDNPVVFRERWTVHDG